ncbi:hypothetical protein JXB02_00210 [Candidatus Woesearchaeota archaeon]|nr:hypothetical protein [Candidatus Woesearchaeota archaeon]
MIKRDKISIIYDILHAIQAKGGKIKPTHLLYKSNLSYQTMLRYLDELMGKGMVYTVQEKKSKFYCIGDKGYQFLAEYKRIKEFTESFGL